MIIGNFTYDPENDTYSGAIRTLSFDRPNVQLRPARKSGEKDPDYRVVEDGPGGRVELGAAWKKRSEKGNSFISVLLDDPALDQGLNAAMFDDRAGLSTLVWNRPRAKSADATATQEASPPVAHRAPPKRSAKLG